MSKMKQMYISNDEWEAFEPLVEIPSDEELEQQYNEYMNRGGFNERPNRNN